MKFATHHLIQAAPGRALQTRTHVANAKGCSVACLHFQMIWNAAIPEASGGWKRLKKE